MPVLRVGSTEIPYRVRRSSKATRMRIEVTPEDVLVVAPGSQKDREVAAYVHRKRKWVFTKREMVRERALRLEEIHPKHYASGAKVPYRGRKMRLVVRRHEGARDRIDVRYRNGFEVDCGASATETQIGKAVEYWLRSRVETDVHQFVGTYQTKLDVCARSVVVDDFIHLWGSCGKQGTIRINWRLIFAPKAVLEYVVVHELAHLLVRNHNEEFWQLVASVLPDYSAAKRWLDRFEMEL